jgi:S-DNA-T family DNA segregation ATPase FtsK/SpoIIIE
MDRMRLSVTLVDPSGSVAPVDVEVGAAPGTPLADVRPDLVRSAGRVDGDLFCRGERLDGNEPLGQPPLLDGAVLTVGRAEPREPVGLLELHVVAGPDAGAVHRLSPGEHGIGRAVEARVRLADPDVSRLHAVLRVGVGADAATTVHDLGSTNGTTVDGETVDRDGCPLRPGQLLRVGDTRLSLAVPRSEPVSCRPDGAGHLQLNRPPRHRAPAGAVRLTHPQEPVMREPTRFPVLATALPLVAGLALVAVTRTPTYLLFVVLSPVMVLGSWLSDRTVGGRARRAQQAEHAQAVEAVQEAVRRAVDDEARARHRAHPGAAALLLAAGGPRPRLWERRPADDDALELRLGLGSVPATAEVRTPGTAGRPETTEHPALSDVPVTVSLPQAGVLGLAGPRDRVLPLARWVVAQVAGWHSPRHTGLVVLAADPGPDWEWTRWLRHLCPGRGEAASRLVGLDAGQVRARVDELARLLDARQATVARQVQQAWRGPWTVVLLDGAGDLRRDPGVARLLADGPAVGVLTVCCDRESHVTYDVGSPTSSRREGIEQMFHN